MTVPNPDSTMAARGPDEKSDCASASPLRKEDWRMSMPLREGPRSLRRRDGVDGENVARVDGDGQRGRSGPCRGRRGRTLRRAIHRSCAACFVHIIVLERLATTQHLEVMPRLLREFPDAARPRKGLAAPSGSQSDRTVERAVGPNLQRGERRVVVIRIPSCERGSSSPPRECRADRRRPRDNREQRDDGPESAIGPIGMAASRGKIIPEAAAKIVTNSDPLSPDGVTSEPFFSHHDRRLP